MEAPKENPNPPDGWKAFTVAVCASIVQAITFGISNSFPTFIAQLLADEDLDYPSDSILSWVQSISLGLSAILSVPAGFLLDKCGPRVVNAISGIGIVAAMLLASLAANSGPALIGLYSLPMGIAMGFMMSTGATATSSWFRKRAALGMGICFTGGGTGSLVVPRIAGALAAKYSWRTSFQILAALTAIHFLATAFVRMRPTDGDPPEEQNDIGKVAPSTTNEEELQARGAEQNDTLHSPVASAEQPPVVVVATAISSSAASSIFNYHTDKATFKQLIFKCLLTRNFIGLFFGYGFFSIGFYSFLYIAVPYPLSMGTGPYRGASSISVDAASNVFVPFGIMQTLGGLANGAIATKSDPRLVFIAAMGLLTVTSAFYSLCRELWEFLVVCAILGYGISGFFATFGTLIAQRYHGPNLPLIMSLGFAGAVLGGFLGSPLATEITNAQDGNYSYATVLMSLSFFVAGLLAMFVVTDVADADAHLKPVDGLVPSAIGSGNETPAHIKDRQPLLQQVAVAESAELSPEESKKASPRERYAPHPSTLNVDQGPGNESRDTAPSATSKDRVQAGDTLNGEIHAFTSPDLLSGSPSQHIAPYLEANGPHSQEVPSSSPGGVNPPHAVPME